MFPQSNVGESTLLFLGGLPWNLRHCNQHLVREIVSDLAKISPLWCHKKQIGASDAFSEKWSDSHSLRKAFKKESNQLGTQALKHATMWPLMKIWCKSFIQIFTSSAPSACVFLLQLRLLSLTSTACLRCSLVSISLLTLEPPPPTPPKKLVIHWVSPHSPVQPDTSSSPID